MNWTQMTEEERRAARRRWVAAGGRVEKFASDVDYADTPRTPEAEAARLKARVIDPADPRYPAHVRAALETPGVWFVRGALPDAPRLAVVGSRAVSHEGVRLCKQIVGEVAAAGVAIVSGGAIGIDTLAHEAAIRAGVPTVAFLPSAFDRLTPARNEKLFANIISSGGALVSEYPSGVTAHRFHFHRRNALIAAFADAVLVVRAKVESGTMITAREATRLGTPLFALPGSPEDATAIGCNALIRDGAAACITCGADVLVRMGLKGSRATAPRTDLTGLSDEAARLWRALEVPRSQDELCGTMAAHVVMVALTELQLCGRVAQIDGKWRRA